MSLKNAIARVDHAAVLPSSIIENTAAAGFYCSKQIITDEDKKAVYNATNGAAKALREAINVKIALKDIYIEPVTMEKTDANGNPVYATNESGEPILDEFGEPIVKTDIAPRIVLFDADGTTYGCVSNGVYNSLKKLCNLMGTPDTWEKPVVIIPKLVSNGKNQVLTFNLG